VGYPRVPSRRALEKCDETTLSEHPFSCRSSARVARRTPQTARVSAEVKHVQSLLAERVYSLHARFAPPVNT
jgi:hypothetical protein